MRRAAPALVLLLLALGASGAPAQEREYEIGPGDVLHVAVFGQQDMTGDFAVDERGIMSFPFLGKVKASEMTTAELERKLTTLLADGYIRTPHVSVTVKEYRSLRVYVTGYVQKPGAYGLRPSHSLLALLGDIGDLAPGAGHEVVIVRPPKEAPPADTPETPAPEASPGAEPTPSPQPTETPKEEATPAPPTYPGQVPGSEIFHISLRDVRSGNPERDFRVETGDTIYFPRAAQIYVTGNVARPGAIPFEEGLTVYQALNLAGGITEKGSKGVKIVRIVDGKRKEFKPKPTDLLQPEDTIVVPERFF